MSGILTTQVATFGLLAVKPMIIEILNKPGIERRIVYVVVLGSNGEILAQEQTDDDLPRDEWKAPYDEIAQRKALLAQQFGMNTGEIIRRHPQLLRPNDPIHAGGVYFPGFAVGAAGGIKDYFEEAIASAVGAMCMAYCQHQVAQGFPADESGQLLR